MQEDKIISEKRLDRRKFRKLREETGHLMDAQWKLREEELLKEASQQLDRHRMQLQQKESEWAEKIRKQTEMSQHLEKKCKNIKTLESKHLTELWNQLEAERHWSELTNTWVAEKISKDSKIDELKAALESATEQQAVTEHA